MKLDLTQIFSFAEGTVWDSYKSIGKLDHFLLSMSQTFIKTLQQTERY